MPSTMRLQPAKDVGDYAIRWVLGDNGLYVDFAITKAMYSDMGGVNIHYGADPSHAITDLATAVPLFHGHVKWDGCINWTGEDGCMSHNCGASDLRDLFAIILRAHRVALEMMGDKADASAIEEHIEPGDPGE